MSFLVFLYVTSFLLCVASKANALSSTNITAVFAFGDSILDSGNNNHLVTVLRADHRPYGSDLPEKSPTGRFSNGKLTTDFVVSLLGLKELLPAYLEPTLTDADLLTGACFASAGSGLDDLTAGETNVLTMGDQLNLFEKALERIIRNVGAREGGRVVSNALYIFAVGSNDVARNLYDLPLRRISYSLSGYHDFLLKNFESNILKLYKMGARKFALSGLPPIGCLPIQRTLDIFGNVLIKRDNYNCVDQQNIDSQAYNTKLRALISKLQHTLSGSKFAYVDIFNPLMDMIKNPHKYGLEETRKGCCGTGLIEMGPLCNELTPTCQNPSNYLFWDGIHPSQQTYYILIKIFQKDVLPLLLD